MSDTDILHDLLDEARTRCDIVIVDTPPGLGSVVRRTLEASQHVLVPLQCEPLALQTTPQILRAIQAIVATNSELTLDGILLTMYETGNPACIRVAGIRPRTLPQTWCSDTVVPRSAATADAFAAGQPVVIRDPGDPAAQGIHPRRAGLLGSRSAFSEGADPPAGIAYARRPLFLAAVAATAGACDDIPTNPQQVFALTVDSAPLNALGEWRAIPCANTNGVVKPLTGQAFNVSSSPLTGVPVKFISLNPNQLTINSANIAIGAKAGDSVARVIAGAQSLQSLPFTLPVVLRRIASSTRRISTPRTQ